MYAFMSVHVLGKFGLLWWHSNGFINLNYRKPKSPCEFEAEF